MISYAKTRTQSTQSFEPDKHTGQVDSSGCGGLASKFPAFQNYSTHRRMGAHV